VSFPAYTDYKDSGEEWLGNVPSHWTVERLTNLYREAIEPGEDHLPILSVSIHTGVSNEEAAPDDGERKIVRSEDRTKYKKVLPGDLAYNMMRAWQGGFGAVQVAGMVSPAYVVARPRRDISSKYVELMLRTPGAVEQMRRLSRGITDFRLRLYWDEFKNMRIALPPTSERGAIISFLDRETGKIDALVDEQRRLIVLLKEKRQAVISYAVTKGLDPDASMKDSGIEWLGKVPAHWQVKPLKYLISLRSGGTPSKARDDFWDGSIPWASAKDLKSDHLDDTIDHITDAAVTEGGVELNPIGSILILVRGMMLARAFPVVEILVPMAINQDLKAVLPRGEMSSQFLAWGFRGTAQESLDRCSEAGHGTKALRMEDWLTMPFPCPPKDEQRAIAAFLDDKTLLIDQLISDADNAIDLLCERRAALISAAVTGKIDVRHSAKVLPFQIERARARGLVATEIIERLAHQPTFGRVKLQKIAYLAEAHVGISEIGGSYLREAAGPLDRAMVGEMERGAGTLASVCVDQPGGAGTTVTYRLGGQRGTQRQELVGWLGHDRSAKLDKLIDDISTLETKGAEAVATLYAVWNDALIDGSSADDDSIVSAFLNDWHPEKHRKFRADELHRWLDWMSRHDLVPTGKGPKTSTGRLFV
jgi:type I restriction enzyme S subunit